MSLDRPCVAKASTSFPQAAQPGRGAPRRFNSIFGKCGKFRVIGSAAMNAFAFEAQNSTAWMTSAAITLGIAIRRSSAP
jgi:hypothetical protein